MQLTISGSLSVSPTIFPKLRSRTGAARHPKAHHPTQGLTALSSAAPSFSCIFCDRPPKAAVNQHRPRSGPPPFSAIHLAVPSLPPRTQMPPVGAPVRAYRPAVQRKRRGEPPPPLPGCSVLPGPADMPSMRSKVRRFSFFRQHPSETDKICVLFHKYTICILCAAFSATLSGKGAPGTTISSLPVSLKNVGLALLRHPLRKRKTLPSCGPPALYQHPN